MSGAELIAWAVVAGVVWLAGYLVWCRIWPYTDCRKCKGAGRFRSPTGRSWRLCRRCKGGGTRLMIGRRIWDKVIKVKKDAVG